MATIKNRLAGVFQLTIEKTHPSQKDWKVTVGIPVHNGGSAEFVVFQTIKRTEKLAQYSASVWIAKQQRALERAVIRLDSEYAAIKPGRH